MVEEWTQAERMFSILNRWILEGKNSPLVCKFLSRMCALAHTLFQSPGRPLYLLESKGFRNFDPRPVGLRIAFPIGRPAFA
jgi:hypothetical protein